MARNEVIVAEDDVESGELTANETDFISVQNQSNGNMTIFGASSSGVVDYTKGGYILPAGQVFADNLSTLFPGVEGGCTRVFWQCQAIYRRFMVSHA